ncbi:TonB-dependent receptor [Aliikangiella coralliicola]|uniref:TonB-dependent receptor n=1 Tax=Aliikangiella coralliicola TaxID=2592383 RepID=A0A545U655_9GAMM|nr:TonB-dependent receptor [Aliikangiella coralliicola]TQV84952.1 TonB-dependent receptor [Aliikangiella coralliicola]
MDLSPINLAGDNFPAQGVEFPLPNNRLDSVYLFNANLRWELPLNQLNLTFNVQNLFDKKWFQGGTTVVPYPQTGRWWKLGFNFRF